MWVNGEGPIPETNAGPGYANWAGGEPNNAGNEFGLCIGFGNAWNDEGQLVSVHGYVVEWDS
jgi:hypothetical protein